MRDYSEYSCPVCHSPLAQAEDVVVCPQCGAPHHRLCWKQIGHCRFADTHGTPQQWRPVPSRWDEDAVICGNCGVANDYGDTVCRKCGHALNEAVEAEDIEGMTLSDDGGPPAVPAAQSEADAAVYIGHRAGYYLARFRTMDKNHSRVSWNWAAALFPAEWLLYRKLWGWFWVALGALLLLSVPGLGILWLSMREAGADVATWQALLTGGFLPVQVPGWLVILSNTANFITLFLRGMLSLYANSLYQKRVDKHIAKLRARYDDPLYFRYILSKRGGTNLAGVIVYGVLWVAASAFSVWFWFL